MNVTLTGKTLGENIKLARLKAGLTGEQLADILLMSAAGVYYYESGANRVPPKKLKKIAEVCGVTVEDLTSVEVKKEDRQ